MLPVDSSTIATPFDEDAFNYTFWQDHVSIEHFHMDLINLAEDSPAKAQDAIDIMSEWYADQPTSRWTVQPDTRCYLTVLQAWLQVGKVDEAQNVLTRMEQLQEAGNPLVAPTELAYLLVIQGYAYDSKSDLAGKAAQQAEDLMRHMSKRGLVPGVKIWSIVLDGWCRRAGLVPGAMARAEALLREMEDTAENNGPDRVAPNVLSYTCFIGGLARSKERDLARQAEAVLERMDRFGVSPDVVAYTSVLNCWSKAVSRRERDMAATRAVQILTEMERLYAKEYYHVKPSLITYATAIRAIGNSLDSNAPKLAENVLARMYNLHQTGAIANLKPTTATYNAVLHALSRAPAANRLRYARRAEQILMEMTKRAADGEKDVRPDVRTWAAVLRAWAQCGQADAAENAQRVLDKLEDMYRSGKTSVRPNFVCYTTTMGAWGNSRRKDALDKMETILRQMEDAYEKTLEADVRPNTVSYVTAIDAFIRRSDKDAATRAQATVDRMLRLYAKGLGHVRPTRTIFNCLIHAYSKSKAPDAATKAEKIFKWMEAQGRAGDDLVRPDEVSLCAVLNVWANQGTDVGAERARQIWNQVKSVSAQERGFELTISMPNIVIKAIARSKDPDAVKKAEQVIVELENDYRSGKSDLRPDVTTASSVINAAAYYSGGPEGRSEAWETAIRTFHKIEQWGNSRPNNITYGTLLKAIANLLPYSDDREELVRSLFDQCCDEGNVDGFVLAQLRHASPQLYRDLVDEPCGLGGPDSGSSVGSVLRNIPSEWSANVVEH